MYDRSCGSFQGRGPVCWGATGGSGSSMTMQLLELEAGVVETGMAETTADWFCAIFVWVTLRKKGHSLYTSRFNRKTKKTGRLCAMPCIPVEQITSGRNFVHRAEFQNSGSASIMFRECQSLEYTKSWKGRSIGVISYPAFPIACVHQDPITTIFEFYVVQLVQPRFFREAMTVCVCSFVW